jgi:two-component system response regulator BaeR
MTARIAVINNDTAFLDLMRELLTEEGYETHAFIEGVGDYPAVRALAPDVIILDIRLEQPEDGWNLLELFRLDPTLTKTPIIVCSADVRALQERTLYLQSQRCQVLPKPFDLDTLLALLTQVLGTAPGDASPPRA